MSAGLNPIILERLLQFGHRRTQLRILRRLAIVCSISVFTVLAAVAVDALWLLTQWQRWTLSIVVYATVAACAAWVAKRIFAAREPLDKIAQAFEVVDPRLREQLLSAVELARDDETNATSSASFRARLQQQVAKAIQPADVPMLLPWQLIRQSLIVAACAWILILTLSLIPGLHFPQRVARAFLPAANLARHSQIAIELIQPSPGNQTLAEGDIVAVVASVTGPAPSSVVLQSRCTAESERSQLMHQSSNLSASDHDRLNVSGEPFTYQSSLTLDSEWHEYRIVADDASTAWYRITTKPRPRAIEFEKRYHYPEYAGVLDQVSTEAHGDIEAIAGTLVTLTARSDLPIFQAHLNWHSSDQLQQPDTTLPLKIIRTPESVTSSTASCQVRVESDRSYRLILRAAETGFENSYSPTYTIRAHPDKSPRIRWSFETSLSTSGLPVGQSAQNPDVESPPQTTMLVRPDAIADFHASIEDEFPIAKLAQLTRINLRDWSERPLDLPVEPSANPEWHLDLLPLKLKVGDIVQTKLVAVDRKGQIAESSVLELVVSAGGFDSHRHRALHLRRLIADELHEFSLDVNELAVTAKQQPNNLPAKSKLDALATLIQERIPALHDKVGNITRQLVDPVSLAELERVSQSLMRIQFETLPKLMRQSEPLALASGALALASGAEGAINTQTPENTAQTPEASAYGSQETPFSSGQPSRVIGAPADSPQHLIAQLSETVQRLDELFHDFHAHDIQAALARDLSVVLEVQRDLTERASELTEEQMRREQAVIGRHFREIERLMIEQLPMLKAESAAQLEQWSLWFANHAQYIEEGTEEHSSKERVDRLAKTVLQQLLQRPPIATIDTLLPVRLAAGHKELDERSGLLFESVRLAAEQLNKIADSSLREAAQRTFDQVIAPSIQQLPARRHLHQLRLDADRLYASDLGNVHRAVKELFKRNQSSAAEASSNLDEVATAFGKLEAIHQVSEAALMLASLLIAERWEVSSTNAKIEHPRLWDGFIQRVEYAERCLHRCGIPQALVDEVRQLLNARDVGQVSQRIHSRRWSADQPVSAKAELERVELRLREYQQHLAPIAAQARATIARFAPSVSRLAQRAAEETRQLKKKTEQAAQTLAANEIPQPKELKEQLLRARAHIDEPISDLREALADTAGAKDLLLSDQLQQARDADTGVAIVDEAKRRTDDTLQAALEKLESTEATQEKLAQAALEQQRTAETLAQIAEHFEQRDPSSVSQSESAQAQQAWRALSQEMNAADAMKQEYSKAEKLSKIAQSDPKSLLQQLEREMNRNIPMRTELSRIARETAQESIIALQQAAQQERDMNLLLEESDSGFLVKKQLLHSAVDAAIERTSQLVNTLVSEAKSAATHTQNAGLELTAVESNLRQLASEIESLPANRSHTDVTQLAQALQIALREALPQLLRAAEQLRKVSNIAVYDSEQELRNRRREMEERQRRVQVLETRDTVQSLRSEEQRLNQADNELREAQQRQRDSLAQLAKAKERMTAEPSNTELGNQLDSIRRDVVTSSQSVESLTAKQATLSARVERARAAKQAIDTRVRPPILSSLNPAAELAAALAAKSADDIGSLADTLAQALRESVSPESLEASGDYLKRVASDQQSVHDSVAQVGENLARSARHEERLQNQVAAQQLKMQATRVSDTAETEVHEAQQSLEHASVIAQAQSTDIAAKADMRTTAASRESLTIAEHAIRQRVTELESILSQNTGSTDSESSASEEPATDNAAQQPTNAPMDSSRMARMLDELDRQLNSQYSGRNQAEPPPANSSQPTPSSSLAEAVRQLASDMNRGREAKDSQSTQSGPLTSMSRASSNPASASQVQVMDANREGEGKWGELRQQAADQVNESIRESVAPQYRKQVETYFRVLSERSVIEDRTPPVVTP